MEVIPETPRNQHEEVFGGDRILDSWYQVQRHEVQNSMLGPGAQGDTEWLGKRGN